VSSIRKCIFSALFLAAILALQTLLHLGSQHVPQLQTQTSIIESRDIDPSALFYTESSLALRAEKQVRQQIQENR
jgi:hypothetical protein